MLVNFSHVIKTVAQVMAMFSYIVCAQTQLIFADLVTYIIMSMFCDVGFGTVYVCPGVG